MYILITPNTSFWDVSVQADEDFEVEMVLRLQGKDLSWTWIYIQAQKDPERQAISCTNFIIRYDTLDFHS